MGTDPVQRPCTARIEIESGSYVAMPNATSKKLKGVRVRGNSIQIDFRFEGIRCRETLSIPPTNKNLQLAANKRASINFDIELGKFNYLQHFPGSKRAGVFGHVTDTDMTIGDLVDWYVAQNEATWKDTTKRGYKQHIQNHIKPGIGKILARNLRPSQIKIWLSENKSTNKKKNDFLAVLRQAFLSAVSDGLLSDNPLKDVKNLPVERTEPCPLDPEEIDIVLASFSNAIAEQFYRLRIWSGLSPSETFGLQWDDVELENNHACVRRAIVENRVTETKNKRRWRIVELLPPAYEVLSELSKIRGDNIWVFTNPKTGSYFKEGYMREHWNRALKKAGVDHQRANSARHTFASVMLSIGVPLSWLKEQMGHSNYRMLEDVYARWLKISPEKRKQILHWFLKWSQNGHIPEAIAHFVKGIQ